MKVDEVVKALRWIASNDEICFNAKQANIAADLLEQQQTEIKQTTKDRDEWRVAAEASRDAIQPKLRAEIAELKASQPVRCGECIHNGGDCPMTYDIEYDDDGYLETDRIELLGEENQFCSFGERRVEG